MSPEQLLNAHRGLWRRAFGLRAVSERIERGRRQLSHGAKLLSFTMNSFYGLKRLTGNLPALAPSTNHGLIKHPKLTGEPGELPEEADLESAVSFRYGSVSPG
jgi:hypothetical protein